MKKKISFSFMFLMYALMILPTNAFAMVSPDKVNTIADIMSWVVICVVPVVGAIVFWKIHVIPEEIAKKRNHPQADSIHIMCLLSLIMGGMLWPVALIWAYSNPHQVHVTDIKEFGVNADDSDDEIQKEIKETEVA
ncbi:DUF3302 domain-containing protein [Flammeovirga pectinis]|uniref:DUF3302 domain-containing protein n=1 Tax=Flammeovirga pectinis TaxID=2494373 RepID=A0A3Q9FNW4_9BACT|nr:DUF3302 domain-containing protein [Flammeovirga pectinis]AZQ64480.1 DUF3302 domain-containing protein [Flammeovirga pectinis]